MHGPYRLPKGWRWVRLGDVAHKPQYGYTASAVSDPVGPKFLRITDITSGQIDWDKVPYCKCDSRSLNRYLLRPGDVLFARSGSVGATILIKEVPQEAVFASYLIRVRFQDEVLPEYADWVLKSPFCQKQLVPQGAAQKNINAQLITRILFPLPSLGEQRRIVAQIEALMERIRETKRLREEARQDAERLWQSVLAQAFPRPGSDLPEGWRWVRLGEMCETKMGGTPSTKVTEYWDPPEIVWITPEDLEKSELNRISSSRRQISRVGLERSSAKLFPQKTVLLSTTATIGKVGIAERPLSSNQQITGIICGDNVYPEFLAYYLLSLGETELKQIGGTATATHINQKNLRGLPIPLLPIEEQRRIVAYLETVWKQVQTLKKAQEETEAHLKELERSILDKAFRGEL